MAAHLSPARRPLGTSTELKAHYEMAALTIGIQFEKSAVEFCLGRAARRRPLGLEADMCVPVRDPSSGPRVREEIRP